MYNNHSQRRTSRPQRNGFSQRGRSGGSSGSGGSGGSGGRNFESNGPANFRVRGKPIQIHDKYVQLARDSASSGDKILTEDLLQHAEHYLRVQSSSSERSSSERSGLERSSNEKNNEQQAGEGTTNERGQSSYSYAPRGHSRRRWAVASDGATEEGEKASEGSSDDRELGAEGGEEAQQAEVERRSSMPLGAATNRGDNSAESGTADVARDNERDYSNETSYE